jgi:hypothetical protein
MDAQSLIACWEFGRRRHPLDRALLLYAAAEPEADPDGLADRPLGARNTALLRLRRRLFGDALKSCVDCPRCGERLEFDVSAQALLAQERLASQSQIALQGRTLRLPTTRDLASIAGEADATQATHKLLERLIDAAPGEFAVSPEDVTCALEAADPHLDISMALSCPACAHQWNAAFDVPTFVWEEIDVRARRLLDEVHALARAYGWSEAQILELTETRRTAYVERVLT